MKKLSQKELLEEGFSSMLARVGRGAVNVGKGIVKRGIERGAPKLTQLARDFNQVQSSPTKFVLKLAEDDPEHGDVEFIKETPALNGNVDVTYAFTNSMGDRITAITKVKKTKDGPVIISSEVIDRIPAEVKKSPVNRASVKPPPLPTEKSPVNKASAKPPPLPTVNENKKSQKSLLKHLQSMSR